MGRADASVLAERLLGVSEVADVLAEALTTLGSGAAASCGADQTVMLRPAGEPARVSRVRGPVTADKIARLVDEPSVVAELRHGDAIIGFLAITHGDGALLGVVAPLVARALAVVVALRAARSELQMAGAAAASMRALLESSTSARLFVDHELRVTMVNAALAELAARSVETCIGLELSELAVPDRETLAAILRRVIQGKLPDAAVFEISTEGPILLRRVWLAAVHSIELDGRCIGAGLSLIERTAAAREEARARLVAAARDEMRAAGAEATIASLLVPSIGDWAVVDLVERGAVRHVGVAHRDPKKQEVALELPVDLQRMGRPRGVALVLQSLRPDVVEADDVALMLASDPELAVVVRALGEGPQLIVPLIHAGALGALTIARIDGPDFSPIEVRAATQVAEAIAAALVETRTLEIARSTRELFADFRDVVARELRDPLAAITGRLYLAAPRGIDPNLDAIRAAVDRMRATLDRLVLAALPEVAARSQAVRICEGTELVRDAVGREQRALEGITLTTHVAPLSIRADRELLTGALATMLAHVASKAQRGGLVVVRLEREGRDALFSVSHDGPGLVLEEARRAFDGLWLGDGGASRLTIARATIESMGGRAWVETAVDSGAAYCFSLPIA